VYDWIPIPLVLSELYKKTTIRIDSLGECELRHLRYDDQNFATQLLLEVIDAKQYTERVLHRQLDVPEISYEQFAEISDDDLRRIARAFIANNQLTFQYFTETKNRRFFDNFRNAISAHSVEFGKQLQQMMKSFGMGWETAFDSIAVIKKSMPAVLDSFREVSKQSIHFNDIFRDFARSIVDFRAYVDSTSGFREMQAALAGSQKSYLIPNFAKEFDSILSNLSLAWNPATHDNFNQHILDVLDNAIRSKGQETDIRLVEQLIAEKISSLPKDKTSLQGLSLLLAVLTLFLQFYQSYISQEQLSDSKESGTVQTGILKETKAQNELINRLVEGIGRISSQLQEANLKHDSGTYYIVQRSANLRVKCTSTSAVISRLNPNQRVRLVERKHGWIHVEYFDYIDAVTRNGWVLKKYLKLIEE